MMGRRAVRKRAAVLLSFVEGTSCFVSCHLSTFRFFSDGFDQDIQGRGQMRRADPIDEEQFPETKLIENSFLLNNRIKIIISVCFFHDGVAQMGILALFFLILWCSNSRLSCAYGQVHNNIQYWRILFAILNCCCAASQ